MYQIKELLNKCKYYLIGNKKLAAKIICIFLIICIAIVLRISKTNDETITIDTKNLEEKTIEEFYVDISGEIKKPGVYKFEPNTRLYEVIERAGGFTENANKDAVNQADFIEDGEKIIIPSIQTNNSNEDNSASVDSSNFDGLININFASKDELMQITGVGDVIADRIIEYRTKSSFKEKEELMNVKGIGKAKYEKMELQVTV